MNRILGSIVLMCASVEAAPVILAVDLNSGPTTGGENGDGAPVCIYGRGFGTTRGVSTIKINGTEVASYMTWDEDFMSSPVTYDRACFEPGSVTTGAIVLRVGGVDSNSDITWTARSGTVYWVTTSGNDTTGSGTFAAPWATPAKCKNAISAGDTCVIRAGTYETMEEAESSSNSTALMWRTTQGGSGTAGNPKAIRGYPGETVNIGKFANSSVTYAPLSSVRGFATTGVFYDYWTMAGLSFRGDFVGLSFRYLRLIGNNFESPQGRGGSAGLEGSRMSYSTIAFNQVRNIGCGESQPSEAGRTQVTCQLLSISGTASATGTSVVSSGDNFGSLHVPFDSSDDTLDYEGDYLVVMDCGGCAAEGESRLITAKNTGASPDSITIASAFSANFSGATVRYRYAKADKLHHAVYFTTDSNYNNFQWNWIHDTVNSTRGFQLHSSPVVTIAGPTPITGTTAGGSLGSRTYYVKITQRAWRGNKLVESRVTTTEVAQVVGANELLTVSLPSGQEDVTTDDGYFWSDVRPYYRVYVGTASGGPYWRQSDDVGYASTWTEDAGGIDTTRVWSSYNITASANNLVVNDGGWDFTSANLVGKWVRLPGAGAGGGIHSVQITSITNATTAKVSSNASTTVSGGTGYYDTEVTSSALYLDGYLQHDWLIEGNMWKNVSSSCVNFATVSPTVGSVVLKNNLMINCGLGPVGPDGTFQRSAIEAQNNANMGPEDTGGTCVLIYNNTIIDGSAGLADGAGAYVNYMTGDAQNQQPSLCWDIRNNIFTYTAAFTGTNQYYYKRFSSSGQTVPPAPTMTNNYFYQGQGGVPSDCTANCTQGDPGISNTTGYPASSMSGVYDAGATLASVTRDIAGGARPQDSFYDIGAWEFAGTAPVVVSPTSISDSQVGQSCPSFTASGGDGGPYTFTVPVGSLPPGCSLASNGTGSGTYTSAGAASFTVQAEDGSMVTGTRAFSYTINATLTITTTTLPDGTEGSAYSQAISATGGGGSNAFSVVAGSLCGGLSLSSGGTISGTPSAAGVCSFTVRVTDADSFTDDQALSITVASGGAVGRGVSVSGGRVSGRIQ